MLRERSKYWATLILLLSSVFCYATDNTKHTLSKDEFINIVKSYHPVVRQYNLMVDRSKAIVLQSRGAFDPTINSKYDRKTFDQKLYYSYFKPELTLPTWYGIEMKAGLEEVLGSRISDEYTPGQTSYVGLKVPANQLFFDKRRATLRQAQAMVYQTEAERRLAVNDLMYDALAAYWNWVEKYVNYRIITDAVSAAEQRVRFIKIEFEQGQRPAIDTIEALTQLQTFYLQENAMLLAYRNAGWELSNFLWLENNTPLDWSESIIPDTPDFEKAILTVPELESVLAAGLEHPKLKSIDYKIDVLEIERKLKAQSFMPKLDLSANLLSKGYTYPQDVSLPFLENNHKVGVNFTMPLFLRDARGAYSAAKFKIQESGMERANTQLRIENKIRSYHTELIALQQQLLIMNAANNNFIRLYQGERLKFENGESSLFILNSRQLKVLETAQKITELKAKYQKAYVALLWSSGTLS